LEQAVAFAIFGELPVVAPLEKIFFLLLAVEEINNDSA